jgi:hypothetical protein
MKILYIDPVINSPTSRKYRYYDGLYHQLQKVAEVHLCRNIPRDMNQIYDKINFRPDCVIFGLGWFNNRSFDKIENLDVPSVCFLFKPQNDLQRKIEFCKINNISLLVTPIPDYKGYEKLSGCRTELFPYGFNPAFFKPSNIEKKYDIGFSGALHKSSEYSEGSFRSHNLRPRIGEMMASLKDLDIFWKSSDDPRTAFIDNYEEYALTIGKSKIWIATQAAHGDITPRFYEILGSGTLLFCQEIPDEYKFLLKDGFNCVEFSNDLSDFKEKLYFYLENPREAQRIVGNAVKFFHEEWTWKHRAQELVKLIEESTK